MPRVENLPQMVARVNADDHLYRYRLRATERRVLPETIATIPMDASDGESDGGRLDEPALYAVMY